MIPKVIHYCWFGNNSTSDVVKSCIKSWEKNLPDYQIKCWNESNSPLSHPFVKQAYHHKKWAFVADFIRLYALYKEGGIYLDTDMYIIKSFDDLLNNACFIGFEDDEYINAAVVGAEKEHCYIAACLENYDSMDFDPLNTIPKIMTSTIKEFGPLKSNVCQSFEGIEVFSSKYFYPYPYKDSFVGKDFKEYIQPETYGVHLWDVSWAGNRELRLLKQGRWMEWFKIFIKSPFREINYYRKMYTSIYEHFNAK